MFYPSPQGNKQIKLYENALVKLQGFHSAFGEDVQIYSKEEIVKQFKMFDSNVKDSMDAKLALIRELRDVFNNNRELYDKVKQLPLKSRVARNTGKHTDKTIIFVSSDVKTEFYLATDKTVVPIDNISKPSLKKNLLRSCQIVKTTTMSIVPFANIHLNMWRLPTIHLSTEQTSTTFRRRHLTSFAN